MQILAGEYFAYHGKIYHTLALASAIFVTTAVLHSWKRVKNFNLFRPTKTIVQYVRTRYNAWAFLFNGPHMIQAAYESCNGRPFELFAPDGRYVFLSSPDQIKEIDTAPDTVLSLQAASKQMLQPMYSMHGFNWFDRRGTEGVGFIRALRTLLTTYLPKILPDLRLAISDRMRAEVARYRVDDGSSQVPVYPMMVKLVVLANSLSFFGVELSKREDFMKAALDYVEETLMIAEVIRLVPRCLAPIVGRMLRKCVSSQAIVYESLMSVAEERVRERDLGIRGKEHNDCIQWIMETSPKQSPWSAQRIVFELIAIWFGSVHAMSTTATFAVEDLCIHPEYMKPLRKELESLEYGNFEKTSRGLPLLDSFIKESARLTPVEALSTRRQALKSFTLRDGTKLGIGDWACTPVKALMQAGEHYPYPLEFNGFRFVDPGLLSEEVMSINRTFQPFPSKLTDGGNTYHVWGTGRMICPGRYYATAIMKLLVAQVVLNYDIDLIDKKAPRWWTWRSSMLPKESTTIRFSQRAEK